MSNLSMRSPVGIGNVITGRASASPAESAEMANSADRCGMRADVIWPGIAEYFDTSHRSEAESLLRQALEAGTATEQAAAYLALRAMAPNGRQHHFQEIYSPSDGTFELCVEANLPGLDKVRMSVKASELTPAQCKTLFPPVQVPRESASPLVQDGWPRGAIPSV